MKKSFITWRHVIAMVLFCTLLAAFGIGGFSQPSGPVHRCVKCEKQAYPTDRICPRSDICWHRWCFKCEKCGMQLNLTNFFFTGSGLYCKKCYQTKPVPIKKNPKPKNRQIQNKSKNNGNGSPQPVENTEED